jgi:TIR domain
VALAIDLADVREAASRPTAGQDESSARRRPAPIPSGPLSSASSAAAPGGRRTAGTLHQPIRFHSSFISHSSKDQASAERLHADLRAKGVRCWFAPHDLPIGAKILDAIDEAIRLRDKVLGSRHRTGTDSR